MLDGQTVALLVKLALSSVVLCIAGCSTVMLPLCPAIAKNSYGASEASNPANKKILEQASDRKIRVRQLSWFSAEFSGFAPSLASFQNDYKFMLCAFDPTLQKIFIRETYISCMNHAEEWITKVNSPNPAELMLSEAKFVENCALAD